MLLQVAFRVYSSCRLYNYHYNYYIYSYYYYRISWFILQSNNVNHNHKMINILYPLKGYMFISFQFDVLQELKPS